MSLPIKERYSNSNVKRGITKKLHLKDWLPFRESTFIMGMTQTGKTTTGKILTKLLTSSKRPVIVFDPNRRWTQKLGKEIVFSPENVIHNMYDIHAKGLCIVQPRKGEKWNESTFEAFCNKVTSMFDSGFFVVVIDELHNFISTFSANEAFKELAKNCHNWDVGYIAIMQRPQEGIKAVFANASHLITFRLKWAGDLKVMKMMLGEEHADRLFISSPNRLPKHNGLYQNPEGEIEEFES